MDVREKLVDIVCEAMEDGCVGHCNHPPCFAVERVVNALIANGVTVQGDKDINVPTKWISVKDRLPDENGYYLCEVCFSSVSDRKSYRRMILYWEDNVWIDMPNCFKTRKPTHWMPMPQPPKGE